MKKGITRLISLFLIVLMLPTFAFAAGGTKGEGAIGKVIFDNKKCEMRIIDAGFVDAGDYVVNVYCKNKTKDTILIFNADDVCLNGYMILSGWMYEEVQPGEETVGQILCFKEKMEEVGFTSVEEIIATYSVCPFGGPADMYKETKTVRTDGGKGKVNIPKRKTVPGEVRVFNDNVCSFTILETNQKGNEGYPEVRCFFENKSKNPVSVLISNVYVNGGEADYAWEETILPGMKLYSPFMFSVKNLKKLAFDYTICNKPNAAPYKSGSFVYNP